MIPESMSSTTKGPMLRPDRNRRVSFPPPARRFVTIGIDAARRRQFVPTRLTGVCDAVLFVIAAVVVIVGFVQLYQAHVVVGLLLIVGGSILAWAGHNVVRG